LVSAGITKKLDRKGRKEKAAKNTKGGAKSERSCFLEVEDNSGPYEDIVLAAFSDIHVQFGHARVEVPRFSAQAEAAEQFDVESHTDLKDSGRTTGIARIGPAELQRGILLEIAKASPRTYPG
jgi:hypothetical protein